MTAFDVLWNWTDEEERARALHSLCRVFLEDFHHRKEEELLFPMIAADRRVHAGGPECVLHFDAQMRSPPLEAARRACESVRAKIDEPSWPPALQRFRDERSPLLIPVEDHEAGRILLRGAGDVLSRDAWADALRLLESYRSLQVRHFRKEDGCLFRMALQLLDRDRWAAIEEGAVPEPDWSRTDLHPLAFKALSRAS